MLFLPLPSTTTSADCRGSGSGGNEVASRLPRDIFAASRTRFEASNAWGSALRVSAGGQDRRLQKPDGLSLTSLCLEGDRPANQLRSFGRASDRDRFNEADRRAGEISPHGEQVTGDPRQEPVRQARNRELSGDFPAVSRFI